MTQHTFIAAMTRAAIALAAVPASAAPLIVQSVPSSPESHAFLLQADADPEPEWAVQDRLTLTIAEFHDGTQAQTYKLPAGISLFDVRDTDSDGDAELAAIHDGRLCYWDALASAATTQPQHCIDAAEFIPLSYGRPRPASLFVARDAATVLAAPASARAWTLTGRAVPTRPAEDSRGVDHVLAYFHIWRTASAYPAETHIDAYRIAQVYEPAFDPSGFSGTESLDLQGRQGGTRRARDAAHSPPAAWPWFTLQRNNDPPRVLYALAPPDHRDTLIRFHRTATPSGRDDRHPRAASSDRRYPGVLIAPHNDPPDFNGDGYADLLMWNTELPGRSLGRMVRAAQSGGWEVTLSVHLFNPRTERYDARPAATLDLQAPIHAVLRGGVSGPFAHLLRQDVDGDGRTDLVTSGTGSALFVYPYRAGFSAEPAYRADFREPLEEFVVNVKTPARRWCAIVRTPAAYHAVSLPNN